MEGVLLHVRNTVATAQSAKDCDKDGVNVGYRNANHLQKEIQW
jgi:hypothetical protein